MKKMILGWKSSRPKELLDEFLTKLSQHVASHRKIYFSVPNGFMKELTIAHPTLKFGAQEVLPLTEDSFTKSIAIELLQANNASFALVHSDEQELSEKIKKLFSAHIIPMVCCGDTTSQERNDPSIEDYIRSQLDVLKELSEEELQTISLIYTPHWINHSKFTPESNELEEAFRQFVSFVEQFFPGKNISRTAYCLLPKHFSSLEKAMKIEVISGFYIEDSYPYLDELLALSSKEIQPNEPESQEVVDI